MIIELAMAGMSVGYWLRRRRRPSTASLHRTQTKKQTISTTRLLQDVRSTLLSTEKDQLMLELDPELAQARKQSGIAVKKKMQLSIGALGIAVFASFYPLLLPLGAAAVIYLSRDNYKLIRKDFKRGHYLSFYLVSAIMNLGLIISGHLILAALNGVVFGFLARIINQLEEVSQDRLVHAFNNLPAKVWVMQGDIEIQVDFDNLKIGDRVIINAGEVVPVDGRVVDGMGQVDQQILTGESQPVDKEADDEVFASTLLIAGRLTVTITTAGDKSVVTQITQVLQKTDQYKDTLILRGRKIGDRFVPVKLGLSAVALGTLGSNAALAVLAANLGNGLSTMGPMVVLTYLQLLARQNILVKDGRIFESLREVDTIIFDKTGTLTEEQPILCQIHALNGFTKREVLTLAATAEYRQPHPIARAIVARAEAEQLDLPIVDEASYEIGYGISVTLGSNIVRVGSARFLQHENIELPEIAELILRQAGEKGHSLIYVAVNNQLAGALEMQPTIRPEAKALVQALKRRNMDIYIISGDHEIPTRCLAQQLGIEHYFAATLPENKANLVQQLRDQGRFVCFVGDGINDAIALKTAQVSISLKGASAAATDTAQIIFMDGTLQHLIPLFELVDEFENTMRRATAIGFIPGALTILGIFFFHLGVVASLSILYLNISLGISNTLWPMIKHQLPQPEVDVENADKEDSPQASL